MPNKWVQHVYKYSKDNNLSYGCTLTCPDLKKVYILVKKKCKSETERKNK